MSEHSTEWLNAYLDGELHGSRLYRVEAHLSACQACQAELAALKRLSGLLHGIPLPEFTSPDRFTAQVNLRSPHRQVATSTSRILEIGWWLIPAGLLAAWIFIHTLFLVNDIFSAANRLGLMTSVSDWMLFGAGTGADWSATLAQFGFLSGSSLDLAATTEAFARTSLQQISLQVSIALLYLSWIAIWWAGQTRQGHGQLLQS